MNSNSEVTKKDNAILKDLTSRIFSAWKRSAGNPIPGVPGLMIFSPTAPTPNFQGLTEQIDGPVLQIQSGKCTSRLLWGEIPVVMTSASQLPLQSASLGLVLLNHVVSNGAEPELEEACRVLKPGGALLVLGLNRNGFRYLCGRSATGMPGLRPLAVREQLEDFDVDIEATVAAGFMRCKGPKDMNSGLSRALIPVADLLLIVARKKTPRLATPLKRTQLRTVSAPSALAGP